MNEPFTLNVCGRMRICIGAAGEGGFVKPAIPGEEKERKKKKKKKKKKKDLDDQP